VNTSSIAATHDVRRLSVPSWVAIALVAIGALNWGLVGFFRFDLVAALFGSMSIASRIVYVLVGAAGLYLLASTVWLRQERHHVFARG
jgi:hypothetical protein